MIIKKYQVFSNGWNYSQVLNDDIFPDSIENIIIHKNPNNYNAIKNIVLYKNLIKEI